MNDKAKGSNRRPPSGLSPAGERIVAALEEATEDMQAGRPLEETFSVHSYPVVASPRSDGPDAAASRRRRSPA
jgi:hypothetical protein